MDTLENTTVSETIQGYVIPTIAVFGVLGNVLALVVWTKEPRFNSAIFLIKCLTVSDIVFLTAKACELAVKHRIKTMTVFNVCTRMVTIYARIFSVHMTLAVVFTRWLSVYKPFHVQTLLTKRRTVVGFVVLMIWCVLVGLPFLLLYTGLLPTFQGVDGVIRDFYAYSCVLLSTQGVSVTLPIVILVVFNVSIAYIMCKQRVGTNLGHRQTVTRAAQLNRLLSAVVCLSVTTVLAYPMGLIADVLVLVFDEELFDSCGRDCKRIIFSMADLLEVFNSSVNVVYYFVFASHFRELFRARFPCGFRDN